MNSKSKDSVVSYVFVQTCVFVTDNRKDTSLFQNMSIYRKLQICNVLTQAPGKMYETRNKTLSTFKGFWMEFLNDMIAATIFNQILKEKRSFKDNYWKGV